MPVKLVSPQASDRFQLSITSYPTQDRIEEVCELIYDSRDKNLIRSLSDLPYTIGRSFSNAEMTRLNKTLKNLNIGHQFKNLNNESQIISYAPETEVSATAKTASGEDRKVIPLIRKTKALSFATKKMVISALIALAIGFAIYFAGRIKFSTQVSSPSAVTQNSQASIESLTRDVEYRKHQDFAWQKASKDLGLNADDGLRTYEDSSAVIKYREGSKVFVKPNTLLIIGKEINSDDRRIRLEDGILQARLKPSNIPSSLAIETKMGTLEMKSPKVGESAKEARIETQLGSKGLQIKVSEGTAVLKPLQPNAAPVEIQSKQEVTATTSAVSSISTYTPSFALIEPKDGVILHVNPEKETKIVFRWEDVAENLSYQIEIASDPEMKNILLNQPVNSNTLEIHYLDPGQIYWRVSTSFEGTIYQSRIQTLNVQEHHN